MPGSYCWVLGFYSASSSQQFTAAYAIADLVAAELNRTHNIAHRRLVACKGPQLPTNGWWPVRGHNIERKTVGPGGVAPQEMIGTGVCLISLV